MISLQLVNVNFLREKKIKIEAESLFWIACVKYCDCLSHLLVAGQKLSSLWADAQLNTALPQTFHFLTLSRLYKHDLQIATVQHESQRKNRY